MNVLSFEKKSAAAVLAAVLIFSASAFAKDLEAGKRSARKPITVTSDSMEANTKENLVIFKGNVEALENFTLCSDELFVRYDAARQISEIKAQGNVRIYDEGRSATSKEALFNNKERTIVLTGNPEVIQCKDKVKGDKITIFLDKKNALVESGKGGRVNAVIVPDKICTGAGGTAEKSNSEETRCKGPR